MFEASLQSAVVGVGGGHKETVTSDHIQQVLTGCHASPGAFRLSPSGPGGRDVALLTNAEEC